MARDKLRITINEIWKKVNDGLVDFSLPPIESGVIKNTKTCFSVDKRACLLWGEGVGFV
jgi:hypothetical protein